MARSVHELFQAAVQARRDKTAAQHKVQGQWRDVTWGEMDKTARAVSGGLVAAGVQPKQMVSILSNTRLDWVLADLGILGAGATTVPIYQSAIAEDVEYILNDSGAVLVFAEDESQLQKLRAVRERIPGVKRVVAFAGADPSSSWEQPWDAFLQEGEKHDVQPPPSGPEDLLTLIYTSGTTGKPKGAMITHDNMLYEAEAAHKIELLSSDDVEYLFLPMAHVFAKVLEVIWFQEQHVMAFWEGDMKRIVDNLSEVRPTVMCSVPRIFEKVYAKVMSDVAATPGVSGNIARWGVQQGEQAAKDAQAGRAPGGLQWTLAQKLVFAKLKTKLGARFGGRMRFFISGGAPLSPDIAWFFKFAGVEICEGFGLTETSAATTVNRVGRNKIGTVGQAMPGTEVKIAPDGEVLVRGRGVMKGYWNKPDATKEAIDADGWFHTGDIGVLDKDGYLKITDRKKDIIVTAGGKNVAPQNLEGLIKSKSPLVSQVVVHGDKRKFLSAVVTVDEENLKSWAKGKGLSGDYQRLSQSREVQSEVENVLKDVNASLASYESIKKVKVLDHDFVVGEQLTPSLKVKRKYCNERYKDIFDAFYTDAGGES